MALRVFMIAPSSLLTDHLPHGDGLVAAGFVREVARRGHELHVAAGRVALRDSLPRNVQVYDLQPDRLRYMWALRRLYGRLSGSLRFDIVHQLNPVEAGVSLALAGDGAPLVLGPYVPEWTPSGSLKRHIKSSVRRAQQRRASVLLVSTPAAASALDRADLQANVHELPHGIDDGVWRPPAERPAGQTILFLSNLEARKGIHVLLDAFEVVAERVPAARLVVGGDGSERDAVQRRVRESPRLARVELLGGVDREDVPALMRASDVYCLPSYGEPFGMGALEAMACGLPVVATAAGGLAHLVPDAGGRKVPPGDAAALADALEGLLRDRALRETMGDGNRELVERRFSWSRVGERLEALYAEAVRASARRRKS